jgi:hypothetical protein
MKIKKLIAYVSTILLTTIIIAPSNNVYANDVTKSVKVVVRTIDESEDDLKSGTSPYYTVEESIIGRFVIGLDLEKNKVYNKVVYEITYGDHPTGWLLNIGDSSTNNGYGGDSRTQSNDAELQIINGMMSVYCNDYGSSRLLFSEPNCAPANGKIRIEISNNKVTYYNYQTNISKTWTSPYLFALNGQSDKEGAPNYKLYTGINRVVDGDYRFGSGIIEAYLIIGK